MKCVLSPRIVRGTITRIVQSQLRSGRAMRRAPQPVPELARAARQAVERRGMNPRQEHQQRRRERERRQQRQHQSDRHARSGARKELEPRRAHEQHADDDRARRS